MTIPADSTTYPFLAISQALGVDYGLVCWLAHNRMRNEGAGLAAYPQQEQAAVNDLFYEIESHVVFSRLRTAVANAVRRELASRGL